MNHLASWPMSLPGSKRKMIAKLWPSMPRPIAGRFVLPFFGTGVDAGFILDQGFHVAGSDSQELLIEWHNTAVACVERARDWLAETEYAIQSGAVDDAPQTRFLELRESHNSKPEAWSLWLLGKLAFGQLVRHSRSGKFNAPFGELRAIPSQQRMLAHAAFVNSLDSLTVQDFELAALSAELGDVVYLDPPYFGTFDAYTGEPFDHTRLIAVLMRLRARGITWAVSNSLAFVDVLLAAVPELADEITITKVPRSGSINSKIDGRQAVIEVLIVWTVEPADVFDCKFCGVPTKTHPSDQEPPADYCDHS